MALTSRQEQIAGTHATSLTISASAEGRAFDPNEMTKGAPLAFVLQAAEASVIVGGSAALAQFFGYPAWVSGLVSAFVWVSAALFPITSAQALNAMRPSRSWAVLVVAAALVLFAVAAQTPALLAAAFMVSAAIRSGVSLAGVRCRSQSFVPASHGDD